MNDLDERALCKTELSPREKEILSYIAKGWHNRQIAEVLNTSCQTVKNQNMPIFEKLGVRNRTAAAIVAIRRGIVEESDA